ncbi:hypothetical protein FDK38_001721 [Candidozyma auris]|nr:hypothetical protein FDK38_001721 [[Candida] auris]
MRLTDLPNNVLDTILDNCDQQSQLTLARMTYYLRFRVYESLYRNIMVVESDRQWYCGTNADSHGWTLLPAAKLHQFADCLNLVTFRFIRKFVVNTHGNDNDSSLLYLYDRMATFWSQLPHTLCMINHDVLSLRCVRSLTNFLASNSVQCIDNEDEDNCEVKRKDQKVLNLSNWFVFSTSEFLALPANPILEQLNMYVESNAYLQNTENVQSVFYGSYEAPTQNLRNLSRLYLHSPLAFLRFTEMADNLGVSDLKLKVFSISTSHRARNNAITDFYKIRHYVDLNHLEELELKMNCTRSHECSASCIFSFFESWKQYNQYYGLSTNLKKLAIVHYKSLGDTAQFKNVVENHVFSELFGSLEEVFINLSDSVKSTNDQYSIDVSKVCSQLHSVPNLTSLHISSFMNEWVSHLPQLFDKRTTTSQDLLVNQCNCDNCKYSRSYFVELARLDKSNNYSHKGKPSDVEITSAEVTTSVDFSEIANIKFLQYVAGQFRRQEHCMERNLHSVGSMLNMHEMPLESNEETNKFSSLLMHSCLNDFAALLVQHAPKLRMLNLGGVCIHT